MLNSRQAALFLQLQYRATLDYMSKSASVAFQRVFFKDDALPKEPLYENTVTREQYLEDVIEVMDQVGIKELLETFEERYKPKIDPEFSALGSFIAEL